MKSKAVLFIAILCLAHLLTACFIPAGVCVESDGGCGVGLIVLYDEESGRSFYDHSINLYGSLRNDGLKETILVEDEADRVGSIDFWLTGKMLEDWGYDSVKFIDEIYSDTSKFYIVVNDPESEHYLPAYETVKIECDSRLYPGEGEEPLTIVLKAKEQ